MSALAVTIIGGYLGAGKTTLVNRLLRQANGARIAVLVNEFGALPIDEDLIEARDDDLITIAGGCVCCSFGSDLTAALLKMAALAPRPDHVLIESSGVALPGAIAGTVGLTPDLRISGICVLADALNIRAQARDEYIGDTIERQLADADLIVLTKTDLTGPDDRAALEAWLAGAQPETPVVVAAQGDAPNAILLGDMAPRRGRAAAAHHDGMYDSVALRFASPVDAAALAKRLTDPAFGVIRAKGRVADISGRAALIQLAGKRAECAFPDTAGEEGLICIGLKGRLDARSLKRLTETG